MKLGFKSILEIKKTEKNPRKIHCRFVSQKHFATKNYGPRLVAIRFLATSLLEPTKKKMPVSVIKKNEFIFF